MKAQEVLDRVGEISARFAAERPQRQLRRGLEKEDFDRLAEAGFLLTGVPAEKGGLWTDEASSARPVSDILRTLARGDPSVALVSSMHPAVLSFWHARPEPPGEVAEKWKEQSRWVAQTALDGHWWGTITSEPGSGGDVARSRAQARRTDGDLYLLNGQKHFGSGSGITSFMITSAVGDGEEGADWFFIDVRKAAWDGSTGIKLLAPWDGHGMAATQSHSFEFKDFPAQRFAWPVVIGKSPSYGGAFVGCIFTAVIVGVVDSAMALARRQFEGKAASLRPFERVELTRAENEAWLIDQAFEGMLRAVEARGADALLEVLRGKTAVAELADSLTTRLCKVVGGGTYGRGSPFGYFFEDVRALGFLRPPWGLAFDFLWDLSWQERG
jgi:alkylation response protein AidB-like acyl-CoA dehydrogenase